MLYVYIALIVIGIFLILVGFAYLFVSIVFNRSFIRPKDKGELSNDLENNDHWKPFLDKLVQGKKELESYDYEDVYINSFDNLKLHAYFKIVPGSLKTIIFVHGYKGNCFQDVSIAIPFLNDSDYNILYIEHRAHGKSEGKYIGFGVLDHQDLLKWIDYVDKRFEGKSSIYLYGLSMGSNTVLLTVDKNLPTSVKGVVADCGYTSCYDELNHVLNHNMHLPTRPFMAMLRSHVQQIAHYDIKQYSTLESVKHSKVPICFIHGEADTFVPTYMTHQNYEACTSKKEIHTFKKAKHAQSQLMHPKEYKKVVLDFLKENGD